MKVFLVILAFFGLVTMQSAIIADMVVMVINILNSFWMMKSIDAGCKRIVKIKKQIVLAAVLCMAVPTVASGCANSAKSGVEALEAGDYKEAQAQFEKTD